MANINDTKYQVPLLPQIPHRNSQICTFVAVKKREDRKDQNELVTIPSF